MNGHYIFHTTFFIFHEKILRIGNFTEFCEIKLHLSAGRYELNEGTPGSAKGMPGFGEGTRDRLLATSKPLVLHRFPPLPDHNHNTSGKSYR